MWVERGFFFFFVFQTGEAGAWLYADVAEPADVEKLLNEQAA